MIIITGEGSGKTRVLTIRIAYLTSLGVDFFSILALTFTNKAVPEMKKRCSYSETFAQTANDLQILDAINGCYEEYKVLKK